MSVRIKINEAGFRELLTGAAAQGILDEVAEDGADKANSVPSTTDPAHDQPYYEVTDASDEERARRRIIGTGARSMAHEAKTHALLRAFSVTVVVGPDVEEMAEVCISAGLGDLGAQGWPVATGTPNPRPDRFIQYTVTGGRKRNARIANHLIVARIHRPKAEAVECGEVARGIAGVLEAAAETVSAVTRATVESCERFDDPDLPEVAVYQTVVAWTIAIPV